jgi:hypothetical protein
VRQKFGYLAVLILTTCAAAAQAGEGFQYAAKVVCGTSTGDILSSGVYRTAVNVHNPLEREVRGKWKVAVAARGLKSGPISQFKSFVLAADGALEIDCAEVLKAVDAKFVKGFVVIESVTELDVVGVYTASGLRNVVESIDIDRVPARRH